MEDNTIKSSERTDWHGESFRVLQKATAAIRARYPDYDSFSDEITRLIPFFKPGDVAIDVYVEGLYLIAKFSWYSQAAARCPEAPWRLANQTAEPANQPSGLQ
jgi:hypothetical protein